MSSEQLSSFLHKQENGNPAKPVSSRGWLQSFGIPLAIVLGFFLLMAVLFGERLLPAREVSLVNVVTLPDDPDSAPKNELSAQASDSFEAPVVFQASGWIEPDPLAVKVTALVSGVVDEVFVLEGQQIAKGELIATLIDDDMQLDLATAQASLAAAQSRLASNEAAIKVMQANLETLQQRLKAAEALLVARQDTAKRFEKMGSAAVGEIEIIESRQQAVAQQAEVAANTAQVEEARARIEQLQSTHKTIEAEIASNQTEVARRELALKRTRIVSPIAGRVMRLLAVPGQQRMLGPDNPDSAAIAYLYDPEKLQARIDVPLAEAAQLSVGQLVKLRSNFLPDRIFRGVVTRITGEADLQRNTLQAKVAIEEPDARMRPDMLCRAEFLASTTTLANESKHSNVNTPARLRLYVPEAALVAGASTYAELWVLDSSSERIQRRSITLGQELRDGYIRVMEGLKPGDRIVVDPPADLESGMRVTAKPSH